MPIEILLVEDNSGDVRLTKEAFRATNKLVSIHVVCDGIETMAFLRQQGAYAGAPRPDIILLDLELPILDGRRLLCRIKADENFQAIPIFIVTASQSEEDAAICLQNGAIGYHRKPVRWEEFEALVQNLQNFWVTKDQLPGIVEVP